MKGKLIRIAIDGPAGSGKSTIAKLLSKKYNLIYIDTGAMYRFAAFLKVNYKMDKNQILNYLQNSDFNFLNRNDGQYLEIKRGENVSLLKDELRTVEVTKEVSKIAADKDIRGILTEKQKTIAKNNNVVMDGRDIGTVVIPDAEIKIFLTASAEERARRRYNEFKEKNVNISYEDVLRDVIKRDEEDSKREVAPLKKAPDAIEVDTTGKSIDEVVAIIENIIQERLQWK